jgi:Tol biopolymer transport system component
LIFVPSVEVVVLYNSTSDREPCYSPNGKKIAYAGSDGDDYEIRMINFGEEGRVQVTDNGGNDHDPSWGSCQREFGKA